jgi:Na+/H+ antiporter NhaA
MSIFIATAGFEDRALLAQAKLSVLVASALAGIIGWVVLTRVTSPAVETTRACGATSA